MYIVALSETDKNFIDNMMTSSNGNIFRVAGPLFKHVLFTLSSIQLDKPQTGFFTVVKEEKCD